MASGNGGFPSASHAAPRHNQRDWRPDSEDGGQVKVVSGERIAGATRQERKKEINNA
jgi:hypothetical protein